jgi:GR25 family glycosyltransferase involved in LPS biosynthesis
MENYFDWKYYISNNRDLRNAGINSQESAWTHWVNHGRDEGRHCLKIQSDFNWKYYINTYSDLNFKNEIIAYEHYLIHGKKEGRKINNNLEKTVNTRDNNITDSKPNDFKPNDFKPNDSKHQSLPSNDFKINNNLKDYIITLLGYKQIGENGPEHTNWFPWNRFYDVFKTLGYKTEWVDLDSLIRNNEKRIFITWNNPTSLELYQSGKVLKYDIIFQKLTSIGVGMNANWGVNPVDWCKEWHWPIYKTFEYLHDLGLNIYAFGCKTSIQEFPEKHRICEKLKDKIFWMSWGGTPFDWDQIKNCKPCMENLTDDISFVGSKWGTIGRGNIDAWEKYISPLERCNYKFNSYGGIGNNKVSDTEMVQMLKRSKICPIIHAPSWQAERGIQDRFYSVFLSGRFGICDNLGAVDIFGQEIANICTEDPTEYLNKTIYYLENPEKQLQYIEVIQQKIKTEFNFYRQWEYILNNIDCKSNNLNMKYITHNVKCYLPKINKNPIKYDNQDINEYFDKIFIVNLKKDVHRKIKILEAFEHFGITNYEFVEGVHIDDNNEEYNSIISKEHTTLWEKINKSKQISNKGEYGCLLAHLNILNLAKKRKYKKWLHLEDDAVFHNDFNELFKHQMRKIPEEWDIIYLGTTQAYWVNPIIEQVNKEVYKANISCGTFAFAVSDTNIDYIINAFEKKQAPSDSTLCHEIQGILNCYAFSNLLIAVRFVDSNIREIDDVSDDASNEVFNDEIMYKKFNWDIKKFNINFLNKGKHIFVNDNIKNEYNKACNKFTSIEEFSKYVKNKKIAIIGPAPSVKLEKNGTHIENNYDIIIRINKQWKHDETLDEYIGKRTDILYNCLDYREDCGGDIDIEFLENKVKFIVSTIKYDFLNKNHRDSQFHGKNFLNWYNYFHIKNKNRIKFIEIDSNMYDYYDNLAQTRINTGLMAILHILHFDIKELYIKGFTFFIDGYLCDYRNNINGIVCNNDKDTKEAVVDFMIRKNKNHDQEKQWKLFKDVYRQYESKIKLDDKLKSIVELEEFPKF